MALGATSEAQTVTLTLHEDLSSTGSPELQRLICPCQPQSPYEFKLEERTRLRVFQENEREKTNFSLRPVKAMMFSPASSKSW
jgi:hypothetical protein